MVNESSQALEAGALFRIAVKSASCDSSSSTLCHPAPEMIGALSDADSEKKCWPNPALFYEPYRHLMTYAPHVHGGILL